MATSLLPASAAFPWTSRTQARACFQALSSAADLRCSLQPPDCFAPRGASILSLPCVAWSLLSSPSPTTSFLSLLSLASLRFTHLPRASLLPLAAGCALLPGRFCCLAASRWLSPSAFLANFVLAILACRLPDPFRPLANFGQIASTSAPSIVIAGGHTASNAPDLFRPPKLSGAGPG